MLPLRDANPSGTRPVVTVLLIAANAVAFYHELSLGPALDGFLLTFGLVPARVTELLQSPGMGRVPAVAVSAFTSMFLHGGWAHLLANVWYLWIFGDNVEDRLGHGRFLVFYLLAGLAAAAAQWWSNPLSAVPMIGASGAIAGVLGAYMVCYPRARITALVPIFYFLRIVQLPAFAVLALWFVLQFFSGALAIASPASGGGVAWWAHIGGFAAGVVLILVFPRRRRARQRRDRVRFD